MSWLSNLNRNSGGQSANRRQGDPNLRIGLSAVVSVYIIYLGIDLLKAGATRSTDGMAPWVAVVFGAVFIAAGGFYAFVADVGDALEDRCEAFLGDVVTDGVELDGDWECHGLLPFFGGLKTRIRL